MAAWLHKHEPLADIGDVLMTTDIVGLSGLLILVNVDPLSPGFNDCGAISPTRRVIGDVVEISAGGRGVFS